MAEVATQEFDTAEYIRQRNEKQYNPQGKQPEKTTETAKVEPAPAEPADHTPKLPKSVRREINKLREEAAFERGRAETLAQLMGRTAAPEPVKADPPKDEKPKREAFANDADFTEALAGWKTRDEIRKADEAKTDVQAGEQQKAAITQQVNAAATVFKEHYEVLKDEFEAATRDATALSYNPKEHMGLTMLLGTSEMQAAVLIYLARHHDQFEKLLSLKDKPSDQIQLFRRLEGRAERLLDDARDKAKSNADKPKPKTAAELDAARPAPSSAIDPRGGSTVAAGEPEMWIMRNGKKVLNPDWKAARNEAAGARP